MLVFVVISLLALAFGQLAALLAIILGYLFPNSPAVFRIIVFFPLCISTVMAFVLSWIALTGMDVVLGLDALGVLLIFFVAKACVWWILVAYAMFCRVFGRSCGM